MGDDDKQGLLSVQGEQVQGQGSDNAGGLGVYYDSFPRNISQVSLANDTPVKQETKVYKRRWYILIMFGFITMTQTGVWNTWGPISTTAINAFGWDNSTIALLGNWGPISYIIIGLIYPWLLQTRGLRPAVASSALLAAIGTSLRVITLEPGPATILIHIGQFLNGLAGPIAMGAITQLTSDWFPPDERVTATALGTSISMAGIAITFVVGPKLVDHSIDNNSSSTTVAPTPVSTLDTTVDIYDTVTNSSEAVIIHKQREDIMKYMYYQCGWAWLVTIIILIYYPSKPAKPPSPSASTERDDYWKGLWSLRKKGAFLVVAMIYGVSLGVLGCWGSVLNINLGSVGISEDTAGWIGCYSTVAACFFGTFIGRFADYFVRYMKFFILVLYLLGTGCFVVFALALKGVIPSSDAIFYATIIAGNCLINGAVPLMFELSCELAYPTSEGAANGLLTYINNIGGLIFLGVFSFKGIGTMWMNWALIGATFICVPLIAMLRGSMNRLEVDEKSNENAEQEIIVH